MNRTPTLTLGTSDGGNITLESSCLLVFVDETGDEAFSDPKHPVFGLGGCATLVSDYVNAVRPAWCQMKHQYFGGADSALHANELREPNAQQLSALGTFFTTERFSRLAAVASCSSALPAEHDPYQIVSRCFLARVEKAALRFAFTRIAILMESSERADALAQRHVGPYDSATVDYFGRTAKVPIDHYFIPKALNEPGAEIADFIMHAVGGQARSDLTGTAPTYRKDFSAVFRDVSRELTEYMNIQSVVAHAA